MADPRREELKVRQRKAVLVAVFDPAEKPDKEHLLDEMKGLVETAGVEVVGELVQGREHPHPGTYLGKGKLDELKKLISSTGADLVVFDGALTPSQERNLEQETNTVIVDRSEVILDIFASTARTYEAKLQVELAQLQYFRNRLKRRWTHLERIEGGVGAGRGPGEKQLETDRRLIDKRIAELKRKLADVEDRRTQMVAARHDHWTVSLVGYTNAGKSTLMNALTGSDVYVANKLFATLDTRTRRWEVPHFGEVLLSDTVGFIRDLPHHLVASFRSTLEEARHAHLLLHVVDASHSEAEKQIATVYKVLEEIGVEGKNVLLVLNKIDRIADPSFLDVLRRRYENAIGVSARTGEGLDRLAAALAERLTGGYVEAEVESEVGNGRLLAYLAEHAEVTETTYHDSRMTLSCRLPERLTGHLADLNATVRVHADVNGVPLSGAAAAVSDGNGRSNGHATHG